MIKRVKIIVDINNENDKGQIFYNNMTGVVLYKDTDGYKIVIDRQYRWLADKNGYVFEPFIKKKYVKLINNSLMPTE